MKADWMWPVVSPWLQGLRDGELEGGNVIESLSMRNGTRLCLGLCPIPSDYDVTYCPSAFPVEDLYFQRSKCVDTIKKLPRKGHGGPNGDHPHLRGSSRSIRFRMLVTRVRGSESECGRTNYTKGWKLES